MEIFRYNKHWSEPTVILSEFTNSGGGGYLLSENDKCAVAS